MTSPQENPLLFSDEMIRRIFDALSAHIAILNENGVILETNAAWKRFSQAGGMDGDADFRGMNYLRICDASEGEGESDARQVAEGIRRVLNGEIPEFLYDYPCDLPDGRHWFYMRTVPMADQGPMRVIVSHEDITALKLAQEELRDKNQSLEEANIAMKVLLKHREADKADMEQKILSNVKTFVLPYIQKLKAASLSQKDRTLVTIAEDHLNDIISPLVQQLAHADLTPQETQVAGLVKDGKTSSEIADILFISEATVNFHRKNLRTKLGLKGRQANLRSYLLSMS